MCYFHVVSLFKPIGQTDDDDDDDDDDDGRERSGEPIF
jgi:hypothetical protein